MKKLTACLALVLAALIAAPALAQDHGGGSGCGDLFGDLIHIKRHATSGVPILAKRWIEYPGPDTEPTKYDWGYCPIAVREDGSEIGFLPLSCDPAEPAIAVDYFGRLSAGRTKERNLRMHFNEAIENIKMASVVDLDEAGRLKLTFVDEAGVVTTKVVDSPVENIALYHRLMKYGHFGTDPWELDKWAKPPMIEGQENVQYHPALAPEDYAKFTYKVENLLPAGGADCYTADTDPETGKPVFTCASPETLESADLLQATSFLATGADKGGKVTVDLLQYMNRILKITTTTDGSASTKVTLPAIVRDCGGPTPGWTPDEEEPRDPDYGDCSPALGSAALPFPANELFVDFSPVSYSRTAVWLNQTLDVIKTQDYKSFVVTPDVPLFQYLEFKNAGLGTGSNIDGFVKSANDALRSVEFLHNYAVPDDLGWNFKTVTRTK
jgi:hypothetical protein